MAPQSDAPTEAPVFASTLTKDEIKNLMVDEAGYDCDAPRVSKRTDYLSWDDYFMAIAILSAQRSKDPSLPSGACLIDSENRVVGIGYNGFPRGTSDDVLPWLSGEDGGFLNGPSAFECHAEVNAILNKCASSVAGARLYVKDFPCNECAKVIIQSRVSEVVYIRDKNFDSDASRASRIMFRMAGVSMRQYTPTVNMMTLDLVETPADCGSSNTTTPKDGPDESRCRQIFAEEVGWCQPVSTKRRDYLSWDDYFLAVAYLTARRSKDPNTQVGACIVNSQKAIVGLGYNGFPRGCSDNVLPWGRQGSFLHKKYAYVCHAEVNAILNKGSADVQDATLYVALFPCNECAKVIIQSGIKEVVYLKDHYHGTDPCRASRIMFQMAGVKLRQHVPKVQSILIEYRNQADAF